MPFTFSHPAIVLPFGRMSPKYFSLTGLIAGSLSPDFEYFLRMKIESNYSHTIPGLFWFDLPISLLIAFMFHNLVKQPLFDNLPKQFWTSLNSFYGFHWNTYFKQHWITVLASMILGAASHLLWDSFTHDHGYFTESIPFLQTSINLFDFRITAFKIAQHMSSALGAIVILIVVYKLPKRTNTIQKRDRNYWMVFIPLTALTISMRVIANSSEIQVGNLIVTLISGILISLILTPIVLKK